MEIELLDILAMIAGSTVAFAGRIFAGRLVGLGLTVIFGVAMAYFLMPPMYSLRVSQTGDVVTLVCYSAIGLAVAGSVPSGRKRPRVGVEASREAAPFRPPETDIGKAMAELMSSDLGTRLRKAGIEVHVASGRLPCPRPDALRILRDVVTAALGRAGTRRISVCASRRADAVRVMVAAHRCWPPPLGRRITIGQRDEDCEPAVFPGWPSHSHATWFDNGHDAVYQVSLEADGRASAHRPRGARR